MSERRVVVIDYGAGNVTSVVKALRHLGAETEVTSSAEVINTAERIVLPGVGHFAATRFLSEAGMDVAIREKVAAGVPFLGICVGFQWLFSGSTEATEVPGGRLLPGLCERFTTNEKVPHVGWNSLSFNRYSRLMAGLEDGDFVYYTHSYKVGPVQDTVAVTNYGGEFSGAVERANVMGVQFHPEKSGADGLRILKNFLEFPAGC